MTETVHHAAFIGLCAVIGALLGMGIAALMFKLWSGLEPHLSSVTRPRRRLITGAFAVLLLWQLVLLATIIVALWHHADALVDVVVFAAALPFLCFAGAVARRAVLETRAANARLAVQRHSS